MNRWTWATSELKIGEVTQRAVSSIRLYDGDTKTNFDNGQLTLTNFRLLWNKPGSASNFLSLELDLIILIDIESSLFSSSKIVLHLSQPKSGRVAVGPVSHSSSSFIKISFHNDGFNDFVQALRNTVSRQEWHQKLPEKETKPIAPTKVHSGILGIERTIQAKQKETSDNISRAFEDLQNLMHLAKDMVQLSKLIAGKIQDKSGDMTGDETVKFRSYLLSLGIDDPVTKETVGSTTEYHMKLASEICDTLEKSVRELAGIMLMSEAYCRINRARGLHLISPEDFFNACTMMKPLNLPLNLHKFTSGICVLQLPEYDHGKLIDSTRMLLDSYKEHGLSVTDMAKLCDIPVLLAKERLIHAENCAAAVRDESSEGLKFFPNLFSNR